MASNNSFLDVLGTIDGKVQRMSTEVKTIRQLATDGHMEDAYAVSLRLAKIAERSTLLTRILPVYSGKPTAYMDVEAVIRGTVPVKVSITDMGWFYVNLPALLPKKEFNSRSYVRGYLFPALNQFFADKDPLHYEDAVIIFRHVYCRDRPERRRRDHDNIEVNCVADTIALFVLLDDSPSVCSHYSRRPFKNISPCPTKTSIWISGTTTNGFTLPGRKVWTAGRLIRHIVLI